MVGIKNKILFGFMLCLMALAFWGCPHDACIKYQDVALVKNAHTDSIFIIANDSIIGCGANVWGGGIIGSKTHKVKFPINVNIQLFSHGDLWKDFFLNMPKNTILNVYSRNQCYSENPPIFFLNNIESAKKHNRFIDSYSADDYCWVLEKMDDSYNDNMRCTELSVGGEVDHACMW